MAGSPLLGISSLVLCCIVGCHVATDGGFTPPGDDDTPAAQGGSAGRAHGGSGGSSGKHSTAHAGSNAAGSGPAGEGGESGEGGEGSESGGSGGSSGGTAGTGGASGNPAAGSGGEGNAVECQTANSCTTHCTGLAEATCTVLSANPCEFNAFVGVSKKLSCGDKVVVGSTNCGGCGMVDVELFFDGERCWQGVPGCPLPELAGKFVLPHKP